jgi:hypothetical protein
MGPKTAFFDGFLRVKIGPAGQAAPTKDKCRSFDSAEVRFAQDDSSVGCSGWPYMEKIKIAELWSQALTRAGVARAESSSSGEWEG